MNSTWSGQLNVNEIFTSIFNMIIAQQVYSNNIGQTFTSLVDRARIDGTLYGDNYLKYSTDALETYAYNPDSSDQLNLLQTYRPDDPFVQALVLDNFRWIPVTIDNYFSKRAFSTESAFADFNSVTLQWLRDTKKIYDATTYNSYVGTTSSNIGSQAQEVDLTGITAAVSTTDEEAYNRLVAETIAQKLADIVVDMKDIGTGYNDLGYYRTYEASDLEIIWNADWINFIRKVGLPTVFHKDGLLEIKEENILPGKYFGTVNSSSKSADAATRSLVEQKIGAAHYWPGELIASGTTAPAGTSYQKTPEVLTDGSIICKIIHKESIPYMSGFETETTFVNGKNLSENHYLHFGHNTLQYLYNYPLVTVSAKLA